MAQKIDPLIIRAVVNENLSETYEKAVKSWLDEISDVQHAQEIYRREVFPLSCERVRAMRGTVDTLDLLFVPVGTQAYAPTMAIVGNPARCVALLETTESSPYGAVVEESFVKDSEVNSVECPAFLHVRISDVDTADIARKMKAVFESRGLPSNVGADVTGGRKPMSTAVAGIGSLYHWRMFYVEGSYTRSHQGFSHHEKVIELANVLDVFGDRQRNIAYKMLERGAYLAAAEQLKVIIEDSAASRRDRELLAVVETALSLYEGEGKKYAARAKAIAVISETALPASVIALFAAMKAKNSSASAAFLLAASQHRLKLRDMVGARELARQGLESMGLDSEQRDKARNLIKMLQSAESLSLWLPAVKALQGWLMGVIQRALGRV